MHSDLASRDILSVVFAALARYVGEELATKATRREILYTVDKDGTRWRTGQEIVIRLGSGNPWRDR